MNHYLPSQRHMHDKILVHRLCKYRLRIQRTEYWQTNLCQPSHWHTQCKQSRQLKSSIHCCSCHMKRKGLSLDQLHLQHTVCKMSALQASTLRQRKRCRQSQDWSPSQLYQLHSQYRTWSPVQHTDRWSSSRTPRKDRCQCLRCLPHSLCMQLCRHPSSEFLHCMRCTWMSHQ